jgi:hypothetical protein
MRIIVAFSALFAMTFSAHAQQEMGGIALKYPFLDTSANHLQFFGEQ